MYSHVLVGRTWPTKTNIRLSLYRSTTALGLCMVCAVSWHLAFAGRRNAAHGRSICGGTGGHRGTRERSDRQPVFQPRHHQLGKFLDRRRQHVQFNNGSGATLNRVTGGNLSQIDGSLKATGSVYLINPQGIVIGPGGQVIANGSFVASTRDVSNSGFMSGTRSQPADVDWQHRQPRHHHLDHRRCDSRRPVGHQQRHDLCAERHGRSCGR